MKLNGCLFCNRTDIQTFDEGFESNVSYECPVCGHIKLTEESAEDFVGESFSKKDKLTLSIMNRNLYEKRGKKPSKEPYTLDDINRIILQYSELDTIEKTDKALINIERKTLRVAERITVPTTEDYSYHGCVDPADLNGILTLLVEQGYVHAKDSQNPQNKLWISAKGYERIRELKRVNQESNSCFVAMWFNPNEMGEVYEKAIRPAIEYKEDGKSESRFEDGFPVSEGHLLIVPKRHAPDWFLMTERERREADDLIRVLKNRLSDTDNTITGFNIGMNCGSSAGQTIFHAHIHLIPRRDGDTPNPTGGVRGVIPDKMCYCLDD